jgi:hypothetical protein
LKRTSPFLSALVSAVAAAAFAVAAVSQEPQEQQQPAGNPSAHHHPPNPTPTNLKVLPKDMTGDEVHELMHKWEAALGTECSTCHAADPKNIGPNGKPRLNYADDSKPEKNTARLMYKMVEEINKNYVSMVENSGVPVSCGTCHRGHLEPPLFVPPPHEHEHDHDHPAPNPGGAKPPAQ